MTSEAVDGRFVVKVLLIMLLLSLQVSVLPRGTLVLEEEVAGKAKGMVSAIGGYVLLL